MANDILSNIKNAIKPVIEIILEALKGPFLSFNSLPAPILLSIKVVFILVGVIFIIIIYKNRDEWRHRKY